MKIHKGIENTEIQTFYKKIPILTIASSCDIKFLKQTRR